MSRLVWEKPQIIKRVILLVSVYMMYDSFKFPSKFHFHSRTMNKFITVFVTWISSLYLLENVSKMNLIIPIRSYFKLPIKTLSRQFWRELFYYIMIISEIQLIFPICWHRLNFIKLRYMFYGNGNMIILFPLLVPPTESGSGFFICTIQIFFRNLILAAFPSISSDKH